MHAVPHASPPFVARVERVTRADLPYSWRPGCPVPPSSLRRIRLSYWGFDGLRHLGDVVVRDRVTGEVTAAFRILYRARFPLRRVETVDRYRGSDDASMAADNTSGFNCRAAVAAGPTRWSEHAYGEAVDVNPVENPYLAGSQVLPPAGKAFVDRTPRPGMAVPGGTLVRAFESVGWGWGGRWTGSRDYQHFSRSGR
jgi:hypothetical protein